MKILVFGRQGQLARALDESLAEMSPAFVARPECDLTEPGAASRWIVESQPDLVINASAYTAVDLAESDPEGAIRLNSEAPVEIAAAAHTIGAPIFHVSTDYVFDGQLDRAYREDDATSPLGEYGRSKLAGEIAVADANPRHLILRTSWLISPWGSNFVRTILAVAEQRVELTVVDDQVGTPTSALDLAQAIKAVVDCPRRTLTETPWGTYHVAGTGKASWFDVARATMQEAEVNGLRSVPVRAIASADWPTPARRPANSMLDSSRFRAAFDFTMPHWRESLREIVSRIAVSRAGQRGGR